jgi:thiamine pyrophosphokinase
VYDALVVVNGEIPHPKLWHGIHYRTLICTDGAAITLRDFSITPDIIIGDMDSIAVGTQFATPEATQIHFPDTKVHFIEDQYSADFEKALFFAKQNNFKQIICLGALGKSADHSIHNLSMLPRFDQELKITLMHTFESTKQWVFCLHENTCITTQIGDIISFFPFQEAILTTQGLKWEMDENVITQLGNHAMRNLTTRKKVTLKCEGICLCFLTSDSPPIIEDSSKG